MGRKKIYITDAEALIAKKQKDKERYQLKKEEIKKKRKDNDGNKKSLEYYHKNKELLAKKKSIYYKKNKVLYSEYGKKYRLKNKEIITKKKNDYQINKRNNDNLFKLRGNISSLIRVSFKAKGFKKNNKSENILGCSFEEFKIYLESKFESWMNRENKGNPKDSVYELNKTWDIDHIVPLYSAKTIEDVIRLNHYSNLRPLCSYTNRFVKKNNLDYYKLF